MCKSIGEMKHMANLLVKWNNCKCTGEMEQNLNYWSHEIFVNLLK